MDPTKILEIFNASRTKHQLSQLEKGQALDVHNKIRALGASELPKSQTNKKSSKLRTNLNILFFNLSPYYVIIFLSCLIFLNGSDLSFLLTMVRTIKDLILYIKEIFHNAGKLSSKYFLVFRLWSWLLYSIEAKVVKV